VKRALLAGVDVSTVWALGEGFGVRLAARIHTLRKRGWPIITQCGSDRIAHYSLPEGWTIADLKEVTDAV